ncbi:MAG: hypothetical protein AABY42_02590 [Nitrospirota bacterium]
MAMALSIVNQYKNVKLEILPVSMMKPGQKAPAVLVDDVIMAEDEGKGDGIADKQEVINELIKRGVVAYSKED